MYKVEAITRMEYLEDIKCALREIEVNGITVSEVMGFGTQRGYSTIVRGQDIDAMMQPKVRIEIVVSSEEWKNKTIDAIVSVARSGEYGDGKIFCYEIEDALKIRTGERGYDAIQARVG